MLRKEEEEKEEWSGNLGLLISPGAGRNCHSSH